MNRTQKISAWTIIIILLTIASLALLLIPIFVFGWCMPLPVRMVCLTIIFTVSFGGLFFATKKQSKNEVETDEMDIGIQKVAAIISLVTILAVTGILLLTANFLWGLNASVPLWVLMLLFGAFVAMASVIYHAAVLIQYGREEKNDE